MNGSTAYAILNRAVEGLVSGVKSHSVDGLTLHLVFNDDSTADIVFEQPSDGKPGENGQSAYEAAMEEGFVGTKDEWLESLKGKDGVVVTCKFPYSEVSNETGNTALIATGEGFLFVQSMPNTTWTIEHNFGNRYPSVVCIDEEEHEMDGNIYFQSENVTIVSFAEPTKGKAFIR